MSKTKAGGSTKNGRDSKGQRLGLKLFGGQVVRTGQIILRQRGTRYKAGNNTFTSKDQTIHASQDGQVAFRQRKARNYAGKPVVRTYVDVVDVVS
ncbi:50S ribosomal protein L27 [Candidatus Saccharibacteria bacterium]|nr:50S ribosomal protein L27 [Candidatus Saccharibacteria bacterium]MCB9834896.1 50S ribosomal protein L27 [Candidatus Nomurabacteria bacterium]